MYTPSAKSTRIAELCKTLALKSRWKFIAMSMILWIDFIENYPLDYISVEEYHNTKSNYTAAWPVPLFSCPAWPVARHEIPGWLAPPTFRGTQRSVAIIIHPSNYFDDILNRIVIWPGRKRHISHLFHEHCMWLIRYQWLLLVKYNK